jgi:hypothetical protein
MDQNFLSHVIGAWKLAGHYDGLYYGFVDGLLDCDVKPSKYPRVTLRRIRRMWGNRLTWERRQKDLYKQEKGF